MSTAVMSNPMFDCGELLFKNAAPVKSKDHSSTGSAVAAAAAAAHTPLRRSYASLVTLIEQHRKLDRSVSEPTSRYKTELCRPFEESGACKYGDKCQFAHGYSELRNLARHPKYKTELCRTFHTIGFCPYGPRCHFIHNFEEARIHNQKVSAQLGQAQPNIMGLSPIIGNNGNTTTIINSATILEQIAAVNNNNNNNNNNSSNNNNINNSTNNSISPSVVAIQINNQISTSTLTSSHQQQQQQQQQQLMRSASLGTGAYNTASLMRTNSLSIGGVGLSGQQNSQNHHHHHHHSSQQQQHNQHQHHHQQQQQQQQQHHHHHNQHQHTSSASVIGTRPKPLNLSPTFSLGSTADSVSPSSSLSQSPTNSMASFFSDDVTTPFSLGPDFGLLTRHTPSPPGQSPVSIIEDPTPRTPSPLSPNGESRLPVFNRISNPITDFDNLKI